MLFAPTIWKTPSEEDILGVSSFGGIESLYSVSGMINGDKCFDVIQDKIVRDVRTAFQGGEGLFQQDLDPCHAAVKVKKVFQEN